MKTLILHLGGSLFRGNKVLGLLQEYPEADVLVSSEGGNVIGWYAQQGVDVVHDTEAWDTVTNFTYTIDRIKEKYSPERIFVVTHDWHMPRSMAIAKAVWFGSGVKLVAAPYHDGSARKKDLDYLPMDAFRAWLWRFTRILLFWKNPYKQRVPNRPVRSNEVAISSPILGILKLFSLV